MCQGSLLNQLAIANESLGGGIVVVMAERDKEEMELDIAKMEFDFRGTSVICRSGSPLILADLKKVIHTCIHMNLYCLNCLCCHVLIYIVELITTRYKLRGREVRLFHPSLKHVLPF